MSLNRTKRLLCSLLLFQTVLTFAQTASLSGRIHNNDKPLAFANVFIKNTMINTSSDENGKYILKNIPIGKQTIIFSSMGYKTSTKEIEIKENQENIVDFNLQEDNLGIDEVVVSGTRNHLSKKQSPVVVTVTNSTKLEAVQAVSLSEGLSFQPGLRFETNCQNCGYSQVRINGLEGSYSQILVNSRPVFSALAGVYGLDQIPANTIERIEVVRGGGSALYGSSAIAGTINIITKDPIYNSFEYGTTLGSIGGKSMDLSSVVNGTVVSEDYDTGLSFFGTYRRKNPYFHDSHAEITDPERNILEEDDGFSEIPKLRNKSFGAKGFFKPNDRNRLTGEITVLNEFRRGGNKLHLLPFQTDITEQIQSNVLLGSLTFENANEAKTKRFSAYASGSNAENENYYGGKGDLEEVTNANNFAKHLSYGTSKDRIAVLGSLYSLNIGKDLFTSGLEYKYNKTNDIKTALSRNIEQVLNTTGLYAQYEWFPIDELKILTGVRGDYYTVTNHDRNDLSDFVINPRVNVMYGVNSDLRLRASYAKGFRAPQFFSDDLHVAIAAGDIQRVELAEDLKAEESHSLTASIDWSTTFESGSEIGLVLEPFYTILNKPFTLDPVEGHEDISIKTNGDNATIIGANLEFNYKINSEFMFQSGFTVQKGEYNEDITLGHDEKTFENTVISNKFMRSPNVYGNFVFTYTPTKYFTNNLSAVYTGSMDVDHVIGTKEISPNNEIELHRIEETPNFFELNWKSAYNFRLNDKHLKLQINGGIQNIFNSYQSDFDKGDSRDAGYVYGPSRPRSFFIGLKIGNNL